MKLSELGVIIDAAAAIRFVGKAEISAITSKDGESYWIWKLKNPIIVGCSTNPAIERDEYSELYLRESALELDSWEGSEKEGFFIKGWVADFSINHQVPLYQDTSIRKWINDGRTEKGKKQELGINSKILDRKKLRAETAAAEAKAAKKAAK